MRDNHAHAPDDEVRMSSNVFASQLLPSSNIHAVQATGGEIGVGPSSASLSLNHKCPCYMYKGTSCSLCTPDAETQPTQPSISSPRSTQGLPRSEPAANADQGLPTSSSASVEKNATVQDGSRSKSIFPLRIRIPRRGATSRAADSQAIQVLPSSSSTNLQVKMEVSVPAPLLFTPAPHSAPPQTWPNQIKIPDTVEKPVEQRIPNILPQEVQIVIDAYISGTPLNVIASKSMLTAHWGVSVPEECGYVYMGFFMVGEVLVRFSISPRSLNGRTNDFLM